MSDVDHTTVNGLIRLGKLLSLAGSSELGILVGVWAGLAMGTMKPEKAALLRQEIEASLGSVLGIAPEALESRLRDLLAARP